MIIGIDASKTTKKEKTGIDNTAYQIILNLSKLDTKNTYYLYSNKPVDKKLTEAKNFEEKLITFPKFWSKFRLPLALMRDKPDVFLQLTSAIPPQSPEKSIVFIHDLAFKIFPEAYSTYELMLQEMAIKTALKKAKKIIFSSEANKNDFLRYYKFAEKDLVVAPLGFDENAFNNKNEAKRIIRGDSPYFLFVGRFEKRKNVKKILEAFRIFKKDDTKNIKLVLAGFPGYGFDEIESKINSDPILKDNVILPGYISAEKLKSLYSHSIGLIFPSLYEGFGLPILEAMACGIPVVTSNIPTIKEVAGDAALLVDPIDEDDIATKMKTVSTDKKTREELIKKGLERVKKFSWKKTTEVIFKTIDEIQ